MTKKLCDKFKTDFVNWAMDKASDRAAGKFEIAMEVWIEKELELYKLNKKIEKLNRKIQTLEIELEKHL